jgi:hypothetical protein
MLKEDTIPGAAEFEDLGRIEGRQINSNVAAEIGKSLVTGFPPASAAMKVDGDCVNPAYDHPLVPELIELLPSLQPGGLRYVLRAVHGGAARTQQAYGSYESLPIGLPISVLSHEVIVRQAQCAESR